MGRHPAGNPEGRTPSIRLNLPPRQKKAAILLGEGKSRKEVAKEIGVAISTLDGWRENSEFEKLREEHYRHVVEASVPQALRVLSEQLNSPNPWVAQNAATRLLAIAQNNAAKNEGGVTVQFDISLSDNTKPPIEGEIIDV